MAEIKSEKKQRKHKKNLKRMIIPAYLIILIAIIVFVYGYPKLSGSLSETMTVEYGTLYDSYETTCYIIRDETVYYASANSNIEYHFAEGDGVRAGTQVVTIGSGEGASQDDYSTYNKHANSVKDPSGVLSAQGRLSQIKSELQEQSAAAAEEENTELSQRIDRYIAQVDALSEEDDADKNDKSDDSAPSDSFGVTGSDTSKSSGTLSYILDGYESALNPYTMGLLDKKKLESLDFETYNADTGKACAGEPVFKVVDRHKWYAVMWAEASKLGSFTEGSAVDIKLPKATATGEISRLYDNGDEIMVVMEFDTYYEDLAAIRKVETTVTMSHDDGLIVDSSFIATEDGQPGVYVVGVTGDTTFTPVKVLGSDGENTLIAANYYYEKAEDGTSQQVDTVNAYDEIKKISKKSDSRSSDTADASGASSAAG